jgi:hypothetical protein
MDGEGPMLVLSSALLCARWFDMKEEGTRLSWLDMQEEGTSLSWFDMKEEGTRLSWFGMKEEGTRLSWFDMRQAFHEGSIVSSAASRGSRRLDALGAFSVGCV